MTQPYLFEVEKPQRARRRTSAAETRPTLKAVTNPSAGPWTLVIPAPTVTVRSKKTKATRLAAAWVTMNGREYWRKRAAMIADWRDATTLLARHHRLPVGVVRRARFDVTLRFLRDRGARRDTANWHPTAKAILDALTRGTVKHPGYGFLPDDAPQFLHCGDCPHIRFGEPLEPKPAGPLGEVVVTITDLSGEVAA